MKFVVKISPPFNGAELWGPFSNIKEAQTWAETARVKVEGEYLKINDHRVEIIPLHTASKT